MTKVRLKSSQDVFVDLPDYEIRQYLSAGSKGGAVKGYLDELKTQPITVAVHSIVFIYNF